MMLGQLNLHWEYSTAIMQSVQAMLDAGDITSRRAIELRIKLSERDRLTNTLERLENGQSESAPLALAANCALLFQDASNAGEPGSRDYLKLASVALLVEEVPNPRIRSYIESVRGGASRVVETVADVHDETAVQI